MQEKYLVNIIRWGTYSILLAPLLISGVFFFPFITPKAIFIYALAEIIFAAYIILAISFPKYRPKKNILLTAFLVFMGVSLLSAVSGADVFNSFWSKYERMTGLLTWFHLLALFVAISSVLKKKDWFKVFQISVIITAIVSVFSLVLLAGPEYFEGLAQGMRKGATLGNSSFFGTYLLFNVFFALYLFLMSVRKEGGDNWFFFWKIKNDPRIVSGIILFILTVALIFSTARAALMSFFLGMLGIFFLKLIFRERGKLKLAGLLLLITFAIGGVSTIFLSLQEEGNFNQVLHQKFRLSLKDRILVWDMGIEGWKEKPLLGWGPENYELVFSKYFSPLIFLPEYGDDVWFDNAHNIVVNTLATQGILGLISYFAIFISAFWVLYRKYLAGKIKFLTLGVFSAVFFSYFMQNLTVFDMPASLLMFVLTLGFIGTIATEREETTDQHRAVNPLVALIVIIVLGASLFTFALQPARASATLIKGFRSEDPLKRIFFFEQVLEFSPLGKYQIRENFDRYIPQLAIREVAESIPIEYQRKEFEFAIRELEKNVQESPLRYSSYLKLGKAYNLSSRLYPENLDKAQEVLEQAEKLSPGDQQTYWALAQTMLFKGKFNEAIQMTEKAIQLEPKVERAHILAIEVGRVIAKITGNEDYMNQSIDRAKKINPSW